MTDYCAVTSVQHVSCGSMSFSRAETQPAMASLTGGRRSLLLTGNLTPFSTSPLVTVTSLHLISLEASEQQMVVELRRLPAS